MRGTAAADSVHYFEKRFPSSNIVVWIIVRPKHFNLIKLYKHEMFLGFTKGGWYWFSKVAPTCIMQLIPAVTLLTNHGGWMDNYCIDYYFDCSLCYHLTLFFFSCFLSKYTQLSWNFHVKLSQTWCYCGDLMAQFHKAVKQKILFGEFLC